MSDLPMDGNTGARVVRVDASRLADVIDVHCAAFFDYPTMRFVLGAGTSDYGDRLAALIGFFIESTYLKGGTILALEDDGMFIAAADAVKSDCREPERLIGLREALWHRLGEAARGRYATYRARTAAFAPAELHHYLGMLGARPDSAGRGSTRPLLERVHAHSQADPRSTGVALETEDPKNIGFYEHFGYQLVGHARVADGLESWGFFRSDTS